ncbi:hypothetical protein [Methylobacterium oxalidis]|uniref:hypothetical protein n=1 Tax=Methylobacterium oxalidis TaxID=944322 RepID=UPI003316246D
MIERGESPLDLANRLVTEAEQRRAKQIDLIDELREDGEVLVHARQVLTEIERTLTVARVFQSVLRSLG